MPHATSIAWMLLWSFSFSIAMSLTKLVNVDISPVIIVFIRSIFGMGMMAPVMMKRRKQGVHTNYPHYHVLRMFLSSAAMVCTYYAYSRLPLATATSIGFTGPCMTVLLAMFIFSEQVGPRKWLLIILGYLGVLTIAQPGSINFHHAIIVALFANFFAACSLVTAKFLTKEESPEQITFINNMGRFFILGIATLFMWHTPTTQDWIYLCMIGVVGTISQYSYIRALSSGKVSFVAPFEYSRLVFAVPIGILFFAETPSHWTFIGSMIIIASNLGLSWIGSSKAKTAKT